MKELINFLVLISLFLSCAPEDMISTNKSNEETISVRSEDDCYISFLSNNVSSEYAWQLQNTVNDLNSGDFWHFSIHCGGMDCHWTITEVQVHDFENGNFALEYISDCNTFPPHTCSAQEMAECVQQTGVLCLAYQYDFFDPPHCYFDYGCALAVVDESGDIDNLSWHYEVEQNPNLFFPLLHLLNIDELPQSQTCHSASPGDE